MINRVDQAMQEVWGWKRRAEEATRGMDGAALIEFYRRQADDVQRKLGIDLRSQDASDARRTQTPA